MVQTIEELAEIITQMRDENQRNKDNFERVLTNISARLELMADDSEATDLLKLYISELKNSVDEKHGISMERFKLLDKAFEQIAHDNVQLAKTADLKELFDSFSSAVGSFSVELVSQKNTLDDVRTRIENVKTSILNKDEIVSLLNELSANISTMSMSYNTSMKDFSEWFETLNFKADFENLDNKINSLLTEIEIIPERISFEKFQDEIENFKDINLEIKEIISQNSDSFSSEIVTKFEKLEKDFNSIVTVVDFAEFRANLAEFVQKIIDNSSALNTQLSFGTEKLESILSSLRKLENLSTKVKALDYSNDFENISNRLDDVFELCENNSKTNYENIVERLNEVKQNILDEVINGKDESIENYAVLGENISNIKSQIELLNDLYSQKYSEVLTEIKNELDNVTKSLEQSINLSTEVDFSEIKSILSDVVNEIVETKSEFVAKNDSNLYGFTAGFDNLKISLENILSVLNLFSDDVKKETSEQYKNVLTEIISVSDNINKFTNELNDNIEHQIKNVKSGLQETIIKLDEFSDSVSGKVRECLFDLQETVASFVNNLQQVQDECVEKFDKISKEQNIQIQNISQEISSFQTEVAVALSSLKDYITELNSIASAENTKVEKDVSEKLLDIETALVKVAQDYENKDELLQNRLIEFAKGVENASVQATEKILSLFSDVNNLSDELVGIGSLVKEIQTLEDANQQALLSKFDEGIEDIVNKISILNDSVKTGLDISIALNNIDENFARLSGYVQEYRNENLVLSNDIEALVVDKFDALKEEFALLNTDISDAVQTKTEDLTRLLEPVRLGIEEFLGFDFDGVVSDIKSQLEQSFMSFTVDVNGEFSTASESICRLEQAYKNTFDKISNIEECVNEKIQNNIELLNIAIENNTKILKDVLMQTLEDELNFSEKQVSFSEITNLNSNLDELSATNKNITDMLSVLNEKLDILAMNDSEESLCVELDEIKDLISEQRKFLEVSSISKASIIDKYLQDMQIKLENVDLEKSSQDIKDSIMNALISLMDQISFVEEAEEIKDFVEEKTDEINQNLIQVQNQLRQMTSGDDDFGYSYTLQDVESDIAKLRLAISNMSDNDFDSFSDDIKKIVTSVETLESSLTQEQITGLKNHIEKLNEDILSISSRTNKLLLTSDESYKALNDGLNNFSEIIYKLEDRINYLDNSEHSARIERKLDHIHSMAMESANADKVFHQVMTYLGEWIDSTTENISRISDKVENLPYIQEEILSIQQTIPDKNSMFEDLREIIPSDIVKSIENKFIAQEARLDRLEMKLDKILSTFEEKDDMVLNRKLDKIETMLSVLGKNIEKLTSYVDEE